MSGLNITERQTEKESGGRKKKRVEPGSEIQIGTWIKDSKFEGSVVIIFLCYRWKDISKFIHTK
jgi:hypothetical protein